MRIQRKVFWYKRTVIETHLEHVCAELVREIFTRMPERTRTLEIKRGVVPFFPFLLFIARVLEQLRVTTATAEKAHTAPLIHDEHPPFFGVLPRPTCARHVGRMYEEGCVLRCAQESRLLGRRRPDAGETRV